MKRPPLSSLLSLIVFHAAAACSVDAAPSTEVLLSTAPKAITGLYTRYSSNGGPSGNGAYIPIPEYEYIAWRLKTVTEIGGQAQISYESYHFAGPDALGNNFLLTEGFLVFSTGPYYKPTHLFVDSTRPVDIEGGLWTFGYRLGQGGSDFYTSWTWTQDPPSTATPPAATNSGAKVRMSLDLNRAVARSLRGKESRKVLSLLKRQQNLLDEALAATQ
jgi:hypothetical protein